MGDTTQAASCFERARDRLAAQEDEEGRIEALVGLGVCARTSGDLAGSEALLSSALQAARTLGDRGLEARAIEGMAWLEQQKRNFEGADILFTRVYNRFTQLDDPRGAGEALLGQAFVARRTGEFDEAADTYGDARDLFLSQRCRDSFGGYARAQLKRIRTHRRCAIVCREDNQRIVEHALMVQRACNIFNGVVHGRNNAGEFSSSLLTALRR